MFAAMNEMWLEVFAVGEHTDAAGNTHNWTLEDLFTIANLYNGQQVHEAPAVLGHPLDDSPAYGWVKELAVIGDKLWAHFVDLDENFVQMLKDRRFKKRSIALDPDLMLRHIGFLGGVPPAVKGLKDPVFHAKHKRRAFAGAYSSYDIPSLNYQFSEFQMNEQQIQMLLAFILETLGQETANQASAYLAENGITQAMTPDQVAAFTAWLQETFGDEAATSVAAKIAELQAAPPAAEGEGTTASADPPDPAGAAQPAQPTNPNPVPAQPAAAGGNTGAHAARETGRQLIENAYFRQNQALNQRVIELEKDKRRSAFAERCRVLEEKGVITPAQRPLVMDFAESLTGKKFMFSESKLGEKDATEQFFSLLGTFKPQIELNNEFASKGRATAAGKAERAQFNGDVDDDRMDHYNAIKAYMKKHDIKSFSVAKQRYERELREGGN